MNRTSKAKKAAAAQARQGLMKRRDEEKQANQPVTIAIYDHTECTSWAGGVNHCLSDCEDNSFEVDSDWDADSEGEEDQDEDPDLEVLVVGEIDEDLDMDGS
ncbi:hypothetical protein FA15DRAFT_710849 [Coprinopsis marcescibilis]|uniref:Uncharacterized protein n=1 Tax=Coprinopsis marcescibilis TaxID=230819 RepID=A0A5C3KBK3_COPMA|nr:hypothetical protein FA15DRAFT_710849 [Coprinopsis marcescibilis]